MRSTNPHGSFAEVREHSPARWFSCGAGYYKYLKDKLQKAKREIFITGWSLNMEVELIRPVRSGDKGENRLSTILEERAMAGVQVYSLMLMSGPVKIFLFNRV